MKRSVGTRALGLLMAVLFCLPLFSLPARAEEDYDKDRPEVLGEGHLTAPAAILIEADSGNVVFEKNADQVMYPASTTKILLVWLALTLGDPEQIITVSQEAVNLAEDESSAKLAAGEEVRLEDLCYAAMLPSGNDAANAIAEGLGGTRENFVSMMNDAARSLGCVSTHFVNPSGIHDDNHYTTARDLAIITRVAMQNPTIRQIVASDSHIMPRDNIYRSRTISNRNHFVVKVEGKESRYYPYSTGVKTGTTSAAGNCLVGSAEKDGISLISVVLGSTSDAARYTDSIRLMDYGFAQYISTSIGEIYLLNPRVVDVRGFDLEDPQVGRLTLRLQKTGGGSDAIVTTREQLNYLAQNFSTFTITEFTRDFRAPIAEGETMGTLTYYPEADTPVTYDLVASRSIAAREQLAPSIEQIIANAENDPNPFPRLTFELVLLYGILPVVAAYAAVRAVKMLIQAVKKRIKVKTFKPTGRYYR